MSTAQHTTTTPIVDLRTKSAPHEVMGEVLQHVNRILRSMHAPGGDEGPSIEPGGVTLDPATKETSELEADVVDLYAVRDGVRDLLELIEQATDVYTTELYRRWAATGTTKITIGAATVHVSRSIKPTAIKGKDALVEALASSPDTIDLVPRGYNYQTLRSWLESLPKDEASGEPVIPEHVRGKVATVVDASIRVRRS